MKYLRYISQVIVEKKTWKRIVTKVTFASAFSTTKHPKFERFIRAYGLRMSKANVTHQELRASFKLNISRVTKNPNGQIYTSLGVITKGTIIEVDVSGMGCSTPTGKLICGKYAQVTNNPENDGVINALLLF